MLKGEIGNKALCCDEAFGLMDTQLDGETTEAEANSLREHLAVCESCRKEFHEREQLVSLVRNTDLGVPAGLHEAVMSELAHVTQEKPKLRWSRFLSWGSAAVACAVAVICIAGSGLIGRANRAAVGAKDGSEPSVTADSDAGGFEAATDGTGANTAAGTNDPRLAAAQYGDSYSFETTAPFLYTPKTANTAGVNVRNDAAPLESLLDAYVKAQGEFADTAVLVCYADTLEGLFGGKPAVVFADAAQKVTGSEASYRVSCKTADEALTTLGGCLTVLETAGEANAAFVPDGGTFRNTRILLVERPAE